MVVIDATKVKIVDMPVVSGLPTDAYVEYSGWAGVDGGLYFVIIRPRDDWGYEDFRCLMGASKDRLENVQIRHVVRYRDGGTTTVETERGNFFFPTPFDANAKPTFNREEITVYPRV